MQPTPYRSYYDPIPTGQPRRIRRRRHDGVIFASALALGLAGLALLPVIALLGLYAYFQAGERILPGVWVGPVEVEGLTVEEAAVQLHAAWNLERKLLVYDGFEYRETLPAELGVGLDPARTAQAAFSLGRGRGLFAGIKEMLAGYRQTRQVQPVVNFDPDAARLGLEALAEQISQPPTDASFYLEGTRLVATPGKLGYTINIEETRALLASAPRSILEGGYLQLKLQPVAPRVTDVSTALAAAQRLLDTAVVIKAYDPVTDETIDLPVAKENLATWLTLKSGPDGPQLEVDGSRAAAYLESLNGTLGAARYLDAAQYGPLLAQAVYSGAPLAAVVRHGPTQYTVDSGDTLLKIGWKVGMPFWKILQANPGLDPEKLWAGQTITIPSKDELLPLPVTPNKRIVISISKQRMWIYENRERAKEFVISTGIDRSPTQPGIFQVQTHERNAYASVWDLHMPNFLGIYEAWPGFMNGIHGLPTLSNGRRLWANILGRPASYGCIILDLDDAEWLYEWAEAGVVVEIRG